MINLEDLGPTDVKKHVDLKQSIVLKAEVSDRVRDRNVLVTFVLLWFVCDRFTSCEHEQINKN